MFKRWSQENFFKYMLENFGIDRLIEYETEPVDETATVVNPEYRELESKIKKLNSKRARLLVQFGAIKLEAIDEPQMVKKYETKMAQLREEITTHETGIRQLKEQRKKIKKHITFAQLPHDKKFNKLATGKKHFIDTIKMIAYRAETSLSNIIRPKMVRRDEARNVIRQIFTKDVNLKPDKANNRLTIELHNLTNEYEDRLAQTICDTLNETSTTFPGTDMEIFYKLVLEKNRRSQEVWIYCPQPVTFAFMSPVTPSIYHWIPNG